MATPTGDSDNKIEKKAFSGFLSYFYGNFVVLLLGFIQTPIVTRLMSTDEYGRTGMFETAVTVIYIFAIMGLDQSYIRFYYTGGVNRDRLLRQCLLPALLTVSVLSLIYGINSDFFNEILFGRSAGDITALVIIYALISVFERFFFLDVRMQQNGRLYSNINITQKILSILTIIAAWYFLGNDFRVALYALVIPWGITTAFIMIRYFYHRRKGAYRPVKEEQETGISGRELFGYGCPFILILLMEWLLSSCDRMALRRWSSFDELGIYTSAMKIIILLLTFKNTFIAYWSPVAMERFEKGDMESNRKFFVRAYDITRFLCVLAATGLIILRRVIVLLLGPDYRGAEKMIPFLTLMPIFAMLLEITNQSIKYSKKNIYLNIASVFAIVFNVAGNALLVPKYGGVGAAVATGISYIVFFAIGSYFSEKCIRIGYDLKKTVLYVIILLIYCLAATDPGNVYIDTAAGLAIIIIVLLIDREIMGVCIGYVKGFIKRK